MDKLKKNAFWVGLGASGALLVALFALLVFPAWGERDAHKKEIETIKSDLVRNPEPPSEEDIDSWDRQKKKYEEDHARILEFYTSRGKEMEQWFPDLQSRDWATFISRYRDEIKTLNTEVAGWGIALTSDDDTTPKPEGDRNGFNWDDPSDEERDRIGSDANQAAVLRLLQKRFWIRKRLAHVAHEKNVKRIVDVRFFGKLHAKEMPSGASANPGVLEYPATSQAARSGQAGFEEWKLPDDLGTTITFGFTVDLPYGDIPRFLEEFLRPEVKPTYPEGSPPMLVNIVGLRAYLDDQNDLDKKIDYNPGENPKDKIKQAQADVKPKLTRLQVTAQAIDFDETKGAKP